MNAPIFGETGPEGSNLGKFAIFLGILSYLFGPKWVQLWGKKAKSEKSSMAGVDFGKLHQRQRVMGHGVI